MAIVRGGMSIATKRYASMRYGCRFWAGKGKRAEGRRRAAGGQARVRQGASQLGSRMENEGCNGTRGDMLGHCSFARPRPPMAPSLHTRMADSSSSAPQSRGRYLLPLSRMTP